MRREAGRPRLVDARQLFVGEDADYDPFGFVPFRSLLEIGTNEVWRVLVEGHWRRSRELPRIVQGEGFVLAKSQKRVLGNPAVGWLRRDFRRRGSGGSVNGGWLRAVVSHPCAEKSARMGHGACG